MQLSKFLLVLVSSVSMSWGQTTPAVDKFCSGLTKKFEQYKWGDPKCNDYKWNHVRSSSLGTPLIWTVFGEENTAAAENTTIVMCGVHGDEITPVKFCWDLLVELKQNHTFKDKVVVVAPLVAPDSFLKLKPTRTNGRGVDVNRNFPTLDWKSDAVKRWKQAHNGDKRKNPGTRPASEQETVFQMNLILRYKPNKVISVHAPLTLLDYDGPSLKAENGKSAKMLLEQMSQKSSGYKVSNYPIFPGSLGNWAGKEKHIPTYTLELPNTNHNETDRFWNLFKEAMFYAIDHKMKPTVD
ncbi:MAG TPA: M14 family zinc carboxypeptidase [Bacteriovoracaceae bacterium]|nr:M14 family zinc carboxypeptidase [Bacteriovoracaceae bacterium]